MQLIAALLTVLAAFAPSKGAPIESPIMGSIEAPTSNAPVSPSDAVPFSYNIVNWCEEGYNNFKVFLTQGTVAPTIDDVDSTGGIPSALFDFGTFTVANFGKLRFKQCCDNIYLLTSSNFRAATKWHSTSE